MCVGVRRGWGWVGGGGGEVCWEGGAEVTTIFPICVIKSNVAKREGTIGSVKETAIVWATLDMPITWEDNYNAYFYHFVGKDTDDKNGFLSVILPR